jgi:lysophospholipase L1-like esterase
VLAVLLLGEFAARAFRLDELSTTFQASADERVGLIRPDPDLFWSMKPNVSIDWLVPVRTNALGLRDDEVAEKAPSEYRILSIGESTSFGYGVPFEKTYAQDLERRLNARPRPGRRYSVINAGVCAYSTFQGARYFSTRGRLLEPDLVLFYHEENDQFPASFRFTGVNLIGYSRTDPELHAFLNGPVTGRLYRGSALFRWTAQGVELARLRRHLFEGRPRELSQFGSTREGAVRRMNDAERVEALDGLRRACRRAGARLVLMHPCYARTERHDCYLTRFAEENGVPLFDVVELFDAAGRPRKEIFIDGMHPDLLGHRLMAEGLFRFLRGRGLA